jgi:kynureninase
VRGPTDLLAYRDQFPATRTKVFLGAHTLAPLSTRSRSAVDRFLDIWETKASAELVWFEDIIPEMRKLEGLYASVIGASADEIVLVPSVSSALSSIASAIDFDERNEIVISRREFPTDCHVWLAQQRRGAKVCWIDGEEPDDFVQAVGERTAVVTTSRVSYLDGLLIDPQPIADAAGKTGAFFVLDDFHGSGVVPLDVHALGVPALVSGPLKYMLGGPGVAFLYVSTDVVSTLEPTVTGWFSHRDFFAFDNAALAWPDTAQRFATGTPSPASIYAAVAGLEIVLEVGVERIRRRTLELTGYLIEHAGQRGYTVRTPAEPDRRGAVVAVEVPDSKNVLEHLLADGIVIDERHGAIRACPHFFASEDDLDALLDALDRHTMKP